MFNVKKFNGTFKGIIGECMFKLATPQITLTNFYPKHRFLAYFDDMLTKEQIAFLIEHWDSIDAIQANNIGIDKNDKYNFTFYEIKTRNTYPQKLSFKPKMTLETHRVYHTAKKIGFLSKLATVWLEDNWNFKVEITEFDEKYYCIDKPKKYDKKIYGNY
ncbi:hypothetical protein HYY69_00290 [Candidatus Woesearchaeota archaeon]|nr:hypothetical protein [Candidatus Woesearchaeota archaeon]